MRMAPPYHPVGTTCHVWHLQGDELEAQTLATLKTAPFNKLRRDSSCLLFTAHGLLPTVFWFRQLLINEVRLGCHNKIVAVQAVNLVSPPLDHQVVIIGIFYPVPLTL